MFGMPQPTRYDLNFRLLGIPVRVAPWFWLISLLLGPRETSQAFVWVGCVFLSILVHEMGHGLTARRFGHHPEIALYGMGGLCTSGADRQMLGQRLAVLFAGPGAQFLLLGILMVAAVPLLGISWQGDVVMAKLLLGIQPSARFAVAAGVGASLPPDLVGLKQLQSAIQNHGEHAFNVYQFLFQINLLWALLNLLPVYPLDGGQIALNIWSRVDRVHGVRRTHILSMITAGCLAAYALSRMSSDGTGNGLFTVLFFGQFAFINYQLLKAHHQRFVEYGPDEGDWWKR